MTSRTEDKIDKVDSDIAKKWIDNLNNIILKYDNSIETMQIFVANCSSASFAISAASSGLNILKSFLIAEHFGTYVLLGITIFGLILNFLHIYVNEIPSQYGVPKKLEEQKKYLLQTELLVADMLIKYDMKKINLTEFQEKYKKLITSAPEIDNENAVTLLK